MKLSMKSLAALLMMLNPALRYSGHTAGHGEQ